MKVIRNHETLPLIGPITMERYGLTSHVSGKPAEQSTLIKVTTYIIYNIHNTLFLHHEWEMELCGSVPGVCLLVCVLMMNL